MRNGKFNRALSGPRQISYTSAVTASHSEIHQQYQTSGPADQAGGFYYSFKLIFVVCFVFDISIKILSLSDAEIYFIRPSVAAWACDGSLQSLCVIPGCHRGCLHIQQSLIKAPVRSLPALCVWGCIYEYDWLLKDNAHIWWEGGS